MSRRYSKLWAKIYVDGLKLGFAEKFAVSTRRLGFFRSTLRTDQPRQAAEPVKCGPAGRAVKRMATKPCGLATRGESRPSEREQFVLSPGSFQASNCGGWLER